MLKRMLALLFVVMLLPAAAMAELNYIPGPRGLMTLTDYDGIYLKFVDYETKWTIIQKENLDEHIAVAVARGESEEKVRARFEDENLLFEAYSSYLYDDSCVRLYCYENDYTRNVWTLEGMKKADAQKIAADVMNGLVLPDIESYNVIYWKKGGGVPSLQGRYYSKAPASYETGQYYLFFFNGKMYMLQYSILGRTFTPNNKKEMEILAKSPINATHGDVGANFVFKGEVLPRQTAMKVNGTMPKVTLLETIEVTGTLEKGAAITAALDGAPLEVTLDDQGAFTVAVPLTEAGEHVLALTATHEKYTDHVKEFTITSSPVITPLNVTNVPDKILLMGTYGFEGTTDPGAQVTFVLNEGEPAVVTADENGKFTYSFETVDDGECVMSITAQTEGKEPTTDTYEFAAYYKDAKAAIKAFKAKGLSEHSIYEIAEDPSAHIGERVMISTKVFDREVIEGGWGFLAEFNQNKSSKKDAPLLYLVGDSYGYDVIKKLKTITIYGVVSGEKITYDDEGEEEKRVVIDIEAGTYLVYR